MKRPFLFLLVTFLFFACSIDDNNPQNFQTVFVPIQSVDMVDEFVLGETYEISMTYVAPNDCYVFNDFYYRISGNERTVAVTNTVYNETNCNELNETVEVSFDFLVTSSETYVFRFYQGTDSEGEDHYYIVEVPVVE